MTTNNKISNLIESQVPFFVRNDHQKFVRFLELYYEYLEQNGKAVERIKNFDSYKDIDRTIDEFTEHFYTNYMKLIPNDVLADKKLLLKHVQDLYRARGTEKSVKFLMNIMFGEQDVDFYYPKKDILKASDGKWFVQRTLRVTDTVIDGTSNNDLIGLEKFVGRTVTGTTSNATAIVERVDRFFEQGSKVDELILSNIKGNFSNGEKITTIFVEENISRTANANVFGGILNTITIEDAGSNYIVGTHPIISNATGIDGNVVISQVSTGNIASITVVDGGAGYRENDLLLISGGGGSGANGNVFAVLSDSSVHPNSYNIVFSTISLESNTAIGNAKYSNLVSAVVDPANNWISNSMLFFTYSNTGPVRLIAINNPGSDYTGVPSISVVANTRIQELGILGRMKIIDGGLNYANGDIITFTNIPGGYGTGALGSVNVAANGKITSVKFVQMPGHIIGGSGYNDSITKTPYYPTANVVSGTGNGANIVVTALLGEGGEYIVANTTLGAIQKISILNRGSGYTGTANIDLTQLGDGKANATVSILEGVYTYPGRFLNDDGFLSSYNFIQDRDYYQNFSYVVKVKASIEKYRKALKDLLHPAGMKLYGQYTVVDEQETIEYSTGGEVAINQKVFTKTYVKTGNTININYASHGLSQNDSVFLEFLTGGNTNVVDGIYTVSKNTLANYFEVIARRSGVKTLAVANAGLGYNSNGFIVFSEENGKKANGSYTVNSNGAIVSVNITDFGLYYSTTPTATANGSNTVPATFTVTLNHYANNTSGNVNVSIILI